MPSMPSPIQRRRGLRSRTKEASSSDNTESDNDISDNDEKISNIGEDEPDSGKNKKSRLSPSTQKPQVMNKRSSSSPTKQEKQAMTKKFAKGVETKKEPARLPPNSKTTKKAPDHQQLELMHVCIPCVMIILAAIVAFYALKTDSKSVAPYITEKVFIANLNKLKGTFPSQSERFWNVIGAAPMSHLMSPKEPERPVVIMLVAQPGTGPTTACIAEHLGKLYTQALGGPKYTAKPVPVNGSDYVGHNADETKAKLDSQLASGFDRSSKAAIIHGFDKLPACSILLFHSYCENDNAQYKDVAIVLTVELDEPVAIETSSSFKDIDSHVDRHLTKYWSMCPDLQRDKKDAMLSRVANNIALVTEEKNLATCSL